MKNLIVPIIIILLIIFTIAFVAPDIASGFSGLMSDLSPGMY